MTTTSNPAETYEQYMVSTLFGPWATRLIQVANPRPGERVLDVACGTGIVARRVSPMVGSNGEVVGLDVNQNMLDVARATAKKDRLDIEWHQGRAEELPYLNGYFDLLMCQFGLMFFSDRRSALAEMHRVLVENGRLALAVWQNLDQHPFYQSLHKVIQHHLGVSGVQDIFALGDANEVRALVGDAGFRRVELQSSAMTARFPEPEAFLAGEIDVDTAAIPAMQHLGVKEREEMTATIRDDMQATLRDSTQGDHVVLRFHAHLVLAY